MSSVILWNALCMSWLTSGSSTIRVTQSRGVMLGNRSGHRMGLLPPIHWLGNVASRNSRTSLAYCEGKWHRVGGVPVEALRHWWSCRDKYCRWWWAHRRKTGQSWLCIRPYQTLTSGLSPSISRVTLAVPIPIFVPYDDSTNQRHEKFYHWYTHVAGSLHVYLL